MHEIVYMNVLQGHIPHLRIWLKNHLLNQDRVQEPDLTCVWSPTRGRPRASRPSCPGEAVRVLA